MRGFHLKQDKEKKKKKTNPKTPTPVISPPCNSRKFKIASPTFLLMLAMGWFLRGSQAGCLPAVTLPSPTCAAVPFTVLLHHMLSPFISFAIRSQIHFYSSSCSYLCASLCCLFFFNSRLHCCIICMKYSSSEHILPTSSAFLRCAGKGAGGFSHTHSYTIMIIDFTEPYRTHGGRIEFRITTIY